MLKLIIGSRADKENSLKKMMKMMKILVLGKSSRRSSRTIKVWNQSFMTCDLDHHEF